MNLTAQQAALAWAQGKRVEARWRVAEGQPVEEWCEVTPLNQDSAAKWSCTVFQQGQLYDFRLAPGETMEEATIASEPETPVDDGGPAYPMPDAIYPNGQVQFGNIGMTLRQHYAGLAMQGFCSRSFKEGEPTAQHIASWAVEQADALLAELRRKR